MDKLRNVTDVFVKTNTVAKCGWTTQPCAQKLNTAWQVQVAGSTIICNLDVAGANSNWTLDMSGAQLNWALTIWAWNGCP